MKRGAYQSVKDMIGGLQEEFVSRDFCRLSEPERQEIVDALYETYERARRQLKKEASRLVAERNSTYKLHDLILAEELSACRAEALREGYRFRAHNEQSRGTLQGEG